MVASYNLYVSDKPGKKYKIVISYPNEVNKRNKTVYFGAEGYDDYTTHKDKDRKRRYISRHKYKENWNDSKTAGFYSRWILWNKPTMKESIKDIKKRFGINIKANP